MAVLATASVLIIRPIDPEVVSFMSEMESPGKLPPEEGTTSSQQCRNTCSGALFLVVAAALVGLSFNAVRSEGYITLGRDYSSGTSGTVVIDPPVSESGNGGDSEPTAADQGSTDIEPDDGIQRLTFEEARDNFETAEAELRESGESIYLFVDARSRDLYEESHIPGALWLYHYESDRLIEELLPALEMAFFVIVYCNGGDCEDSLHLAADLSSLYGIPGENIYVFEGGLNEWTDNGMPVVAGSEPR